MAKNERVLAGTLKWGVSCVAVDEMQMGVLIGAMTLLECENIAWQPIRDKKPSPEHGVAWAGGGRPRGRKSGQKSIARSSRRPAMAVAARFLQSHAEFTTAQFRVAMTVAGWSRQHAFKMLSDLHAAKSVERVSTGKYRRVKIITTKAA